MRSRDDNDAAEFVADLVRIGVDRLTTHEQLEADAAMAAMRAISDQLCIEYARCSIYVPAAFDPRNRDIVRKYQMPSRTSPACSRGRVRELAREYALSTRWVYALVRKARARDPSAV